MSRIEWYILKVAFAAGAVIFTAGAAFGALARGWFAEG